MADTRTEVSPARGQSGNQDQESNHENRQSSPKPPIKSEPPEDVEDPAIEATQLHEFKRKIPSEAFGNWGTERARPPRRTIWSLVKSFWMHQVVLTTHHEYCRDHYALERTYLSYLRTSLIITNLGVVLAQLFRLNQPEKVGGFFSLGIPVACACIGAGAVVLLLGAHRAWRQQNAIHRGKIHVGGWEVVAVGVTFVVITLAIFILIVAVDAEHELD
ncbi:hypothetical protein MMC12_006673 [Toensbergia leucococca]|nr:hypothetical protein [Toensbergia leucococca]